MTEVKIDALIEQTLRKEIEKCHAPVSGYFVTCALITQKNIYFGHNYEHEHPTIFEHAEERTLKEVLKHESNPVITRIVMFGGGRIKKFKYYIPCFTCAHTLLPYVNDNTFIDLMPLAGTEERLSVTFKELILSYQDFPYSRIKSVKREMIVDEIQEKTILKGKDLEFVVDLTVYGKRNKVGMYLTGSSTGRGAVSNLIIQKTNGTYNDLDLICVSKDDYKLVELAVEELIIKHYGFFEKVDRQIPEHQNVKGVVLKKTFYYCGLKNRLIDFTFSTDFKGSFLYHAYELKNWFHELS